MKTGLHVRKAATYRKRVRLKLFEVTSLCPPGENAIHITDFYWGKVTGCSKIVVLCLTKKLWGLSVQLVLGECSVPARGCAGSTGTV